MKIQNFYIGDIIKTDTGEIKIISYEGTVMYRNSFGLCESQLYKISYNNEIYYVSDMGLLMKDTSIFDRVIANIGYRGYSDFKNYKKEYSIWKNMLYRCYWNNSNIFEYYGNIGITVDPRWHSFECFLYDIVNIPGYDKFINSNITYEIDLSTRQKNIPLEQRKYIKGKVSLKPFYKTDISTALELSKSKGSSQNNFIDSNMVIETVQQEQKTFQPNKNGKYPLEAYSYLINNPPQLSIPRTDNVGTGFVRTYGGIYNIVSPLYKKIQKQNNKKEMCRLIVK